MDEATIGTTTEEPTVAPTENQTKGIPPLKAEVLLGLAYRKDLNDELVMDVYNVTTTRLKTFASYILTIKQTLDILKSVNVDVPDQDALISQAIQIYLSAATKKKTTPQEAPKEKS